MMVVALIFIPNPTCSLWIGFAIVSIEIGVIGYMSLWEVNLDSISMIQLIMCIGFSVDFAAHISYAFLSADVNTPDERVRECLYALGFPIIQGGLSTVLGVTTLLLVNSYIFITFFKTVFLVIFFGIVHGLFLIPVLLSVFGPGSCKRKPKVDDSKPGSNYITNGSLHGTGMGPTLAIGNGKQNGNGLNPQFTPDGGANSADLQIARQTNLNDRDSEQGVPTIIPANTRTSSFKRSRSSSGNRSAGDKISYERNSMRDNLTKANKQSYTNEAYVSDETQQESDNEDKYSKEWKNLENEQNANKMSGGDGRHRASALDEPTKDKLNEK